MNEPIALSRSADLKSVGEFERRFILARTEDALKRAGVVDILPTPLDEVRRAAGISELGDIRELPADIAANKPSGLSRIIGAYLFRRRIVLIDGGLSSPRRRFTDGHEITHSLLPSHVRAYLLDDERIFKDTEDYLDLEANVGATYLLFQGPRFHRRALDYETSIETPKMLAGTYGASYHATIRFYVENHPEAVALVVTGRIPRSGGHLPAWSWTESPSFSSRFGPLANHVGRPGLNPLRDLTSAVPFARLASEAAKTERVQEEVPLADLNGEMHGFVAQAWFNQHVHFLMLVPKRRLQRGRRIVTVAG